MPSVAPGASAIGRTRVYTITRSGLPPATTGRGGVSIGVVPPLLPGGGVFCQVGAGDAAGGGVAAPSIALTVQMLAVRGADPAPGTRAVRLDAFGRTAARPTPAADAARQRRRGALMFFMPLMS